MKALILLLLVGCATATKQTDSLVKRADQYPPKTIDVPFVEQKDYYCGPAATQMVLKHLGREVPVDDIRVSNGTYQAELLSFIRRQGLSIIPVSNMDNLIQEVSAGYPVIVFRNLGFSILPMWHYSVITGHDLSGPDIIMHSSGDRNLKLDMRFFERSWKLAGYWGILVLPPEKLSVTGTERDHLEAAAMLERLGLNKEAATSYETILKRWPRSVVAHLGVGNTAYNLRQYQRSLKALKRATRIDSRSAVAWYNLSEVQRTLGLNEAEKSKAKALSLADPTYKEMFK